MISAYVINAIITRYQLQGKSMRPDDKLHGWARIGPAFLNTLAGFKAAWSEPAFYMEAWIAAFMCPFAFVLGKTWLEIGFLLATLALVLIVELLNTGIESAIDRMGYEWNSLSKRAKDLGSAAVFMSLLLCGGVWLLASLAYWQVWP